MCVYMYIHIYIYIFDGGRNLYRSGAKGFTPTRVIYLSISPSMYMKTQAPRYIQGSSP